MDYPKADKYSGENFTGRIMGPNPLKLSEELLSSVTLPPDSLVLDLGSGQGVTSAFLAAEYGLRVFAADLWSDPTDNMRFFESLGLTPRQIVPVHADANELPFARDFFDAVVCTDSYNYFGREEGWLGRKLLPFVRPGGLVCIAVPGMVKDCHDALPKELLLSWTPEQLDYIHDADYWKRLILPEKGAQVLALGQMESNTECWDDWLKCDNEYARGDRKSMDAGAGKYLNFIKIILRRV